MQTFKLRLKALEAKVAQEGVVLTENRLTALEKAKQQKEAHGELETEYPGSLGSQDTFYVGTLQGGGRIYQQTFIDTCSKEAFAKLKDYNEEPVHSGKYCFGKTPMQTFLDSMPLVKEKILNNNLQAVVA